MCKNEIASLRQPEKFAEIFKQTEERVSQLQLSPIYMPRKHKTPKKFSEGSALEFEASDSEEFYRVQYFTVLDKATTYLSDTCTSSDLIDYRRLTDVLLSGSNFESLICRYPELSRDLRDEVKFFRTQFKAEKLEDCRKICHKMVPEVRRMFPRVEVLLRLLLPHVRQSIRFALCAV